MVSLTSNLEAIWGGPRPQHCRRRHGTETENMGRDEGVSMGEIPLDAERMAVQGRRWTGGGGVAGEAPLDAERMAVMGSRRGMVLAGCDYRKQSGQSIGQCSRQLSVMS
jgi:hypothetical protein